MEKSFRRKPATEQCRFQANYVDLFILFKYQKCFENAESEVIVVNARIFSILIATFLGF
jgi:hypothetical protein